MSLNLEEQSCIQHEVGRISMCEVGIQPSSCRAGVGTFQQVRLDCVTVATVTLLQSHKLFTISVTERSLVIENISSSTIVTGLQNYMYSLL